MKPGYIKREHTVETLPLLNGSLLRISRSAVEESRLSSRRATRRETFRRADSGVEV